MHLSVNCFLLILRCNQMQLQFLFALLFVCCRWLPLLLLLLLVVSFEHFESDNLNDWSGQFYRLSCGFCLWNFRARKLGLWCERMGFVRVFNVVRCFEYLLIT